jgi:hypothetical protein
MTDRCPSCGSDKGILVLMDDGEAECSYCNREARNMVRRGNLGEP